MENNEIRSDIFNFELTTRFLHEYRQKATNTNDMLMATKLMKFYNEKIKQMTKELENPSVSC